MHLIIQLDAASLLLTACYFKPSKPEQVARDQVRSEKTVVLAKGLNIIVLPLRVTQPRRGEPIGLRINMRLRIKDSPTHIDLAAEMLTEVADCKRRSKSVPAGGAKMYRLASI
jgi:hypothetical protein